VQCFVVGRLERKADGSGAQAGQMACQSKGLPVMDGDGFKKTAAPQPPLGDCRDEGLGLRKDPAIPPDEGGHLVDG
jgi:hypothetical protein